MVEATPKYGEGINLKVPVRISFHGITYFFNKEKLEKCSDFLTGRCINGHPLIFSTQSLITSPNRIKFTLAYLNEVFEHLVLPNFIKNFH